MLHRGIRFKHTYWSSRRASSPLLPAILSGYPSTRLTHSGTSIADQAKHSVEAPVSARARQHPTSSTQNPLPWRKIASGPAYEVRDESVEPILTPVLAGTKDGQQIGNEEERTKLALKANGTSEAGFRSDRTRFWIVWRSYMRSQFPLKAADRASASRILAEEQKEAAEFIGNKTWTELRQQWDGLPQFEQNRLLPRILIGTTTISARQTLRLLQALPLIFNAATTFQVRMDCLLYIKRAHLHQIAGDPELEKRFTLYVRKQIKMWRWPFFRMQHKHLLILLEHCSPSEVSTILDLYLGADAVPNPEIILALVDFFTRHREHVRALSYLKLLPREDIAACEPHILRRCTNLLKLDFVQRQGSSPNFRIFPELLELGIRPDVILHNIVIQNASTAGASGVAWDLFRYLKAEALEIDSVTYLVLLKDAFRRQDVDGLNEILTAIHEKEGLARDPHLVICTMNVVRIICMVERKLWPEVTFSHMLAVYDRAFSRTELVKLELVGPSIAVSAGRPELLQPQPATLAFTVWLYVLAQKRTRVVRILWSRLLHLISEGDAGIIDMARQPHLYDGFVLFYCRSIESLPLALEVVQHMLDHDFCQPTEKTWTFLIYGFLRHEKLEAAEKIKDMMLDRGIRPAADAWTRIVARWPESDIAAQARSAMEGEVGRLDPDFAKLRSDRLFVDMPAPEGEVDIRKSELVFNGWNELIDFRLTPDSLSSNNTS